jgi:hypothetical protein
MCVAARVSRAFFAIFLQPRLALQKMGLCAEQRFQISIRPLALVRQGSCVKEHTEFSGSISATKRKIRWTITFGSSAAAASLSSIPSLECLSYRKLRETRQRSCLLSNSIPAIAMPILILPQGTKLPVTESLRSRRAGWRQSLAFSKGYGF